MVCNGRIQMNGLEFGGTIILGQCGAMLGWWVRCFQDVTFDFPPSSQRERERMMIQIGDFKSWMLLTVI